MLNLLDYLTPEDNKKIETFILNYGIKDEYIGNKEYLSLWAENNKKLFHLLGGNLIYKVPLEYQKSQTDIESDMRKLGKEPFFEHLYYAIKDKTAIEYPEENDQEVEKIWKILKPYNLYKETIVSSFKIKFKDRKGMLQLQSGMKIMKAFQKVISYYAPENKELLKEFEAIRIKHSMILNDTKIKGNLCFSIHPLDFLTMSDNTYDWSSCMSWKKNGCYRAGTVEMMNSNNIICVYIEGSDSLNLSKTESLSEDNSWNSKRWRELFCCTKEIILGGKSYPYSSDDLTKRALEELRNLAEKNWNHTYEFGIERYMDMIHVGNYYRMKNNKRYIEYKDTKKKNILFDTKIMYNDLLNDNERVYWCIRNKVKKNTIISYSGKASCLCCNNSIRQQRYDEDNFPEWEEDVYNARYDNTDSLICKQCLTEKQCYFCSDNLATLKIYNKAKHEIVNICCDCWKQRVRICPDCGKIFCFSEWNSPALFWLHRKDFNSCTEEEIENWLIFGKREPYFCCTDCLKKNLNSNSDFIEKIFENDYGVFRKRIFYIGEIDKESDFFKNHLSKNSVCPDFEEYYTRYKDGSIETISNF